MAFSLSNIFSRIKTAESARPTHTIGIDVGSSSVKVVEVEEKDDALMLRTYGELQLGPYAGKSLGEVVSLDNKQRIEAVTDVMREASVGSRHGALAMPLSSSFMTVVPITGAGDEDLAERIPVEARKYVPLPLPEVTLDWTELQSNSKAETNVREVMLAAIENKALEDYRELLKTIGMTGEPAEVEPFSLVRSLWKSSDKTIVIIDIGARTSKLYIVRNEVLERLHRVAAGGAQISVRLSQLLNISQEDAENLKRTYEKDSEHGQDVYKTMASVLDGPLSEFKRIVEQYQARTGEPIDRVVFSGGVSASPFFLSYAQDALGVPAEIGNPFGKLAYPAFMEDTLGAIAPTFGVSVGAALRRFLYK